MSGSVRLSQLPAVSSIQATDELEVSQGGASRKASVAQIASGIAENININSDQINDASPVGLTLLKSMSAAAQRSALGLGNVNNTSDADKPISTAVQSALDSKPDFGFTGGYMFNGFSMGETVPQSPLINVQLTSFYRGKYYQLENVNLLIGQSTGWNRSDFACLQAGPSGFQISAFGATLRFSGEIGLNVLVVPPFAVVWVFRIWGDHEYLLALCSNGAFPGSSVTDSKGNVRDLPANNRGAAYTAAIGDTGRVISSSAGGVTIPSAVFSEGQAVSIYNRSNSSQTITQGSGLTMYQAGTTNTGNRTLAPRGFATIWFEAGNICVISGNIT